MIYKLFNYLKSVSIESEEGIQTLTHEGKYYQNDHVCLEVQEVNHNEIQFKVVNADCEIKHIYVDFINPIENVKATLDDNGNLLPISEDDILQNQCYVYSDWGTYALGIENGYDKGVNFQVDPNEIHLSFDLNESKLPCYRLLFEKYLSVYKGSEIVNRFKHQLGY